MAATDEQKAILLILRKLLTDGEESVRSSRRTSESVYAARDRFAALSAYDLERNLLHNRIGQLPDER